MSEDNDMREFTNATNLLLIETKLTKDKFIYRKKNTLIPATEDEISTFKKTAKTISDVEKFISLHFNGNATKILDLIQIQKNAFKSFEASYPEIKELKVTDRYNLLMDLLTTNFKNYSIQPLTASKISLSQNLKISLLSDTNYKADDCLWGLQMSLSDCDFNFNATIAGLYSVGVITIISTWGVGSALVVDGVMIGTAIALVAKDRCYTMAGYSLDHCASLVEIDSVRVY